HGELRVRQLIPPFRDRIEAALVVAALRLEYDPSGVIQLREIVLVLRPRTQIVRRDVPCTPLPPEAVGEFAYRHRLDAPPRSQMCCQSSAARNELTHVLSHRRRVWRLGLASALALGVRGTAVRIRNSFVHIGFPRWWKDSWRGISMTDVTNILGGDGLPHATVPR